MFTKTHKQGLEAVISKTLGGLSQCQSSEPDKLPEELIKYCRVSELRVLTTVELLGKRLRNLGQ